jgi:release factor glutamine methyltransferase
MNELHVILKDSQLNLSKGLSIDIDEAGVDVRLLMQQVLNVNHAWLISHASDVLSAPQMDAFNTLFQRRLAGEPMAYILGQREFYGLNLKTNPATLIPRPDTEVLVESALAKIPTDTPSNVLDLGTGSGAIALAIASQRPWAKITAVDFSEEALQVARENAAALNLNHVTFKQSSWFSELTRQQFDLIVSNPPYIAKDDVHLNQGDLRFEPITALASGVDGLDDIRVIVANAPQHLNQNGWLMLEHGYDQADAVSRLLADRGFIKVSHALDLAGIQRVTMGCWSLGS